MEKIQYKHELKTCPRCGTGFECKTGNILQCQCYGIDLPEDIQQKMESRYRDCLCRCCLEELSCNAPLNKPAE